jgi:hypothetical protein
MRKITFKDSFALSRIIDKTNLNADINKIMDEGKDKGQEYVGGQIFLLIAKKWHLAEKEIVEFLASLFEMDTKQIELLSISETKDLFKQFFEAEEIKKLISQSAEESK